MAWDSWYPLFSVIAYFGSLSILIAVHVFWIVRRFRSFRALDWASELLVTWSIAVAIWRGIRRGPVWDTDLPGSPVWLRGLIALVAVIVSILGTWWLIRKANRLEQPENQARSALS
ncbi:hypothetical protein OO015_11445 [Thermomicrobium sp. 4228-Ro]|uniref:hypothetical protein n=1 Tax=Thermomicrobium sp. 4228-Ro TaxID=2993937 RepID=UPI002248C431|nr:hypothetical protein [Thermomicrobium sp. 4228-Ro]MCX2728104.1 hypothetical protein [Thermomicrobium sp. 4228-Ro]